MNDVTLDQRLVALEARLGRLETILGTLNERLASDGAGVEAVKAGIQAWVTEYVSLRLQQLVPETCEHAPDQVAVSNGPVLPGTRVRCTDEVLHRLGRIPIPFVRQMVTQKVAETARAENVGLVDVPFFERAATFWQCKLSGEDLLSYDHWQQHVMSGPKIWLGGGRHLRSLSEAASAVPFDASPRTRLGGQSPRSNAVVGDEPVRIPIEDALDLHAFAPRDVRSVVDEYLCAAHERGFREVRLIHGRGTGVQRASVQALLRAHPLVAGFVDAPPERGGWGATVVRLREP